MDLCIIQHVHNRIKKTPKTVLMFPFAFPAISCSKPNFLLIGFYPKKFKVGRKSTSLISFVDPPQTYTTTSLFSITIFYSQQMLFM